MVHIGKKEEIDLSNNQLAPFFDSIMEDDKISSIDKEIKEKIIDVFRENEGHRSDEKYIKDKIAKIVNDNTKGTKFKDVEDLHQKYKEFLKLEGKIKGVTNKLLPICEEDERCKIDGNKNSYKGILGTILKRHQNLLKDEEKIKHLDMLIENIKTGEGKHFLEIPEQSDSRDNAIECLLEIAEKCTSKEQILSFCYLYHMGAKISYTNDIQELIAFVEEKDIKYFKEKEYLFEQYKKINGGDMYQHEIKDLCNGIDQNSKEGGSDIQKAFRSAAIIAYVFKEILGIRIINYDDSLSTLDILTDQFYIAELKEIDALDALFVAEKMKQAAKDGNIEKSDIGIGKVIALISLCKKKRYTDKRVKEMDIKIHEDIRSYTDIMKEIFYYLYGRKEYPVGYSQEKEQEEISITEKYGKDQLENKIPDTKEILEYFDLSLKPDDLRYNSYDWNKINNEFISPLYYLSQHPGIKEFIHENFKIGNMHELIDTIKEIREQEQSNKGYMERLETIKAFYDHEKIDMNAIDILLRDKKYSLEYIRWLVRLKQDTGYDTIENIKRYSYADSKLGGIKVRFEDQETYQQAKEIGLFTKFDNQSGEYSSNIYKYGDIKKLLEDKDFLGFLLENEDLNFINLSMDHRINEDTYDEKYNKTEHNHLKEYYAEEQKDDFQFMDFAKKNRLIERYDGIYRNNSCVPIIKNRKKIKAIFAMLFKDKKQGMETFKDDTFIEILKDISQNDKLENIEIMFNEGMSQTEDLAKIQTILSGTNPKDFKKFVEEIKDTPKDEKLKYIHIFLGYTWNVDDTMIKEIRTILGETKKPVIKYLGYKMLLDHKKTGISDVKIGMDMVNDTNAKKQIAEYIGIPDREPYQMIIETIILYDPELKDLFYNQTGKKLSGGIKNKLIENIAEYIKKIAASEAKTDHIDQKIHQKLKEIAAIYQSSDSSPVDKICLFMDQYNPLQCNCPDLKKKLEGVSDTEEKKKAAYDIYREDIKVTLEQSGNKDMLRQYKTKNPEKYKDIINHIADTDKRNRGYYESYTRDPSMVVEEGDMTHGTNDIDILTSILDFGNLAGEFLKDNSKVDATPFGVDIIKIQQQIGLPKDKIIDNRGFGSNGVFLVFKKNTADQYEEQNRLYPGVMGSNARLIRTGTPSTEIAAIIIPDSADFETKKQRVLTSIASKGFFIPTVDMKGAPCRTPETFDEMKVFYNGLSNRGYPQTTIDTVYQYYLDKKQGPEDKHSIVLEKAFEYFKNNPEASTTDDLAIIISFLKNNDLNTHPLERYKDPKNTFEKMIERIKQNIFSKTLSKTRDTFFDYPQGYDTKQQHSLAENIDIKDNVIVKPHGFIDNFIKKQLEFIDPENYEESEKEAKNYLKKIMFFDSTDEKGAIKVRSIIDIAKYFSEKKKELMQKIREDLRNQEYENKSPEEIALYKSILIPVITGSGGRGEVTLGSDLDYALFIDDEHLPSEVSDKEHFINELASFINTDVKSKIGEILEKNGIRADAGLGKKGRTPFSLVSRIKELKIDLQENRQEEEPTEIMVNSALFEKDQEMIKQMKKDLIVHSPDRNILDSFIVQDLEIGKNKKPFIENFLEIQRLLTSGEIKEDETINNIKDGLQRSIGFKLMYIVFTAFENGRIDASEAKNTPSDTLGLMDFLHTWNILDEEEIAICKELWAITYKLRFIGEIYSPEGKNADELKKVKNISFKTDEISYNERKRLIELLKEFTDHIIYK